MITRLILINVMVFVAFTLIRVIARFSEDRTWYDVLWRQVNLSGDWSFNMTHPWVLVTHMFLHIGLFHILWNMILFYWFGRRVEDLIGTRHILPLYLYGGLAGALMLMLSAVVLGYAGDPIHIYAHGASAAMMAFVVAAGMLNPNAYIHLLLIGPVRLKYVVGALVLLDIMSLGNVVNTGGHFAHLGGAMMGWFYIFALRQGLTLGTQRNAYTVERSSKPYEISNATSNQQKRKLLSTWGSSDPYLKSDSSATNIDEEIDRILEKIKTNGIESLSAREKRTLDEASKS